MFDYISPDVVKVILDAAGGKVPFILDCIGSQARSVRPIAETASAGISCGAAASYCEECQ